VSRSYQLGTNPLEIKGFSSMNLGFFRDHESSLSIKFKNRKAKENPEEDDW
jgi:hypothetical protein